MEKIEDEAYDKFVDDLRNLINEAGKDVPTVLIVGMLEYMKQYLCSNVTENTTNDLNYL